MSRNSSGVYSLPSSVNPVTTLTKITVTWANTTLADIGAEITNSVDRAGRGDMTGALKVILGNATAPGVSFTGDNDTGIWSPGANQLALSSAGTQRVLLGATGNVTLGRTTDQGVRLFVDRLTSGTVPTPTGGTVATFCGAAAVGSASYITALSGNVGKCGLLLSDTDGDARGRVEYDHATERLSLWAGGSQYLTIDSVSSDTSLLGAMIATACISRLAPMGYTIGAGGTATMGAGAAKNIGVTIDKPSGRITTNNAALAANTAVSFTFTNVNIDPASTSVTMNISAGATAGAYQVAVDSMSVGSCRVTIRNLTGGSLSETLVLNFSVVTIATS